MNHWHNEFMAEYHRHAILQDAEQVRLEQIALKSRVYRPRFYAHTILNFANWMIATGKQLRKRYEVPTVDRSNVATESFAN